jgi:ditrans,polycis-polyprenyl diphosphate synthase
VVTIYAFSLENFHRPKEQVDDLMKLLENLMVELNEEDSVAMKYDVQVRVIGRLDLLVEDLQRAIATTVNTTRGNQSKVLNVCIAYTGRDEITTAIKGAVTGGVLPDKITAQGLTDNMMIKVPTPDILIRTSGVCRLSDFML